MNVALYGRGARWTMTDRGESALRQTADTLQIGPSSMRWDGSSLVIAIDEIATPHMSRIRGELRLHPTAITSTELPLSCDRAHVWRPFAPTARIEVALERPGWQWSGHGYFDANFGTRALETDFRTWTWARLPMAGGTLCLYDIERRDASELAVALLFAPDGAVAAVTPPPVAALPRTLWALPRHTRADCGAVPRQAKPMLDAPFYCRSQITTQINGVTMTGVHESLDLERFANPFLKPMLALRVPRRKAWSVTN